ncbi:serine-threonine protein kinase [Streptomyces sp. 4503]|uniref:Serine-threonine protein kinase n=1 Tax=Streptomyces niphimycinicus TaxID=2842201 RepID=A0ABS6C8T1_9ACTN|nr:serine-threonine protein kinase [Streptomyces niphimycinicus]MBU3863297.1 serine-threonine protein kinase [Streptomyces niphimycinicus]
MTGMSVRPYWELRFDAYGEVDLRQRDRLLEQAAQCDLTDLVVFAHGWNNTRAMATRLYDRFFAPFPELLGEAGPARLGYVGVVWPSMRFADESLAGLPAKPAPGAPPGPDADAPRPGLDAETHRALDVVFPGRRQIVARLAELLTERPERLAALDEFGVLVRGLVRIHGESGAAGDAADGDEDGVPAMFGQDVTEVCERFAAALTEARAKADAEDRAFPDSGPGGLWDGAHELLRQGTYYVIKRRAAAVGREGLGPALGALAAVRPAPRLHLVGHSFGGRLVSYALTGLPEGATVASVTLLQGAFSHYAFAGRLPHAAHRGGALRSAAHRVRGPVVSCHSHHDTALGLLYPEASRAPGNDASPLPDDTRWGAIGYDGFQAVEGCPRLDLAEALEGPFPAEGCVSVDVSEVVRHGVPPAGAHSDICHPELARVVLRAGRIGDV